MSLESTHPADRDPAQDTGRSLAQGAARSFGWGAFSFGANRALVFISTLVLARLLSSDDFGTVAAAMAVVLYFEIALDLGVGASVVYEQEEGLSERVRTAFSLNLLTALALTALGVACAPALAAFFHLEHQVTLFRVLFLYLLVRGCSQVQDSVLKRDLRFSRRMVLDVTRGAVRAVVSIGLATAGLHAWAMVWGLLAGEVAALGLTLVLVPLRPTLHLAPGAPRMMLRFGLTVLALKVTDAIEIDSDYLVVGHRLGPSALGYYTVGFRLPELLMLNVFWIFSSVAFPAYSRARTLGTKVFGPAMLRALRLISLYSFPAGTALAATAPSLVTVLFGHRWDASVLPMQLVALAAALASIGYASGDIYSAQGRPGTLLAVDAPKAALIVIAMWVVAPAGIAAVAAVHLVSNLGYAALRIHLANRIVGTTWRESLHSLRPALCVALGMALLAVPLLGREPGVTTLLLQVVALLAGAGLGLLAAGRSTVQELVELVRSLR